METILNRYDFVNASKINETNLQDELNNIDISHLAAELNLSALKNVINIFIKKICVKEYIEKQPRFSPGTWMAITTMKTISSVIIKCRDTVTIQEVDGHDCLFDLLLAMIRVGPGTSHNEVMQKLISTEGMSAYLKDLDAIKLQQMVAALKEHSYTPENNMSLTEYSTLMSQSMPRLLKTIIEDRKDQNKPEIWSLLLDLYMFYILHTNDVPDELHVPLENCLKTIVKIYDNPYKGFPDSNVIQKHLQKMITFVSTSDFPRGKQINMTTSFVKSITTIELEAVWSDMMLFFKALCLARNVDKMSDILRKFGSIFEQFDAKTLQKNSSIFETWAVTMVEILEKMKENRELLGDAVYKMNSDLGKKYKPAKGDEKYWFPLTKAVWSIPTKRMQAVVVCILQSKNLKRMWNWKENIQEAKNMIAVVERLDLPTEEGEDHWETRDSNNNCGEAVDELIKMLKIQKVEHKIMAELARMSLTYLEKRQMYPHTMVDQYCGEISFVKVPEIIPEIVGRFEPLITDADYPWLDDSTLGNGLRFAQAVMEAYNSGDEMPNDVNQAVIRILEFCMEDDCERINIENGNPTVWGAILQSGLIFISKHCVSGTADICLPLFDKVLKFRNSEEETLRELCSNIVMVAGNLSPSVCVKLFGPLLDWYIEEPSSNLISIFCRLVEFDCDVLSRKFDPFVDACKDDADNYNTQAHMFYILSTKQPMIFSQKAVDMLMAHHFLEQEPRIKVLMTMMNVTKDNQSVFVPHMNNLLNDKKVHPMEQQFVNVILVNVAKEYEEFKEPVFNYLMELLKTLSDERQINITIASLKDMFVKFGPDLFESQKNYIVNRRNEEVNTDIKDQLSALIDVLEGRSLETVAQDVKDTQDDVNRLDTKVTGTQIVVGSLTTRVDQHDENIQEIGEGLDTVTQRVDFAEQDIEETKVKVEEIDNKTMTNAPKWSKDLTKLMNPPSEHDWRLLAQRLGYNNDDIRAWAAQHDPCMTVLSEWYATHKTREANYAVLTALQEMNRMDGAAIVENAMKAVEGVVEDEEVEYTSPPPVFLSYQWGHQEEVKLIRNHLKMAGYECWMDIGQMGGGDKLFEKIDNGIRGAKVVICCVSEKYAKSPNCNREVNLSVNLGKPMIPLLMEKMAWPPKGSMGPIFSEYLFIRFFQRAGEETEDNRIWPVAKFQEMLMQLSCYGVKPDESIIDDMYKNWWMPIQEVIVIDKSLKSKSGHQGKDSDKTTEDKKSPDVFISYQWGKQKEIMALYQRLTSLGLSCWMDIYQMGGGDSLYEKIDSGVRGCKVILTCITQKYSLSANCRREVSLADAVKKPMIPLLLEKMDWPPSGPMSMVFTQLLFINCYRDEDVQLKWTGPKFDELLEKIEAHIPEIQNTECNETQGSSDAKKNDSETIVNETKTTETNNSVAATPANEKQNEAITIRTTDAKSTPMNTDSAKNSGSGRQKDQSDVTGSNNKTQMKSSKSCSIL